MRNKTLVITLLLIFSACIKAFAETTIKAEVDKLSITLDETVTYKLIIGSTEKRLPEPTVPDFAGFNVISQAQSSTISFVKGGIQSVLVYAFILEPQAVGKFKIKPSLIKVKNKTISSAGFEIEVKPEKPGTKKAPEEKPAPLPEAPPESQEPQVTL
jgi:hypothetical protein